MTTQNLLVGIKDLLDKEYEKAAIKLLSKDEKRTVPNVYIGFLPQNTNAGDYPAVIIIPPTVAKENEDGQTLPITLALAVIHKNLTEARDAWMDILTLTERTREILIRNKIVAGAFRLASEITWGIDSAEYSQTITLGEINVTYETVASYQEII